VMLTGRGARGLFLPSVWDQLPEAADFLRHLKAKAGLRPDDDLVGVHAERFVTVKVDASALPAGERLWTA
jgi:AMMECR1 domain-containing protein